MDTGTGKVLQTEHRHQVVNEQPAVTVLASRAYDHAERLKSIRHQINSGQEVILSSHQYNEVGQEAEKDLHSTDGTQFLQQVNLRYNTRGRNTVASETPVTVDVLASDIIALLDALRIPEATLIGVSLGGVTVLNTSLLYPTRVKTFISCDTNSSAPETNRKAWNDRAAIAEAEGAKSASTSEPIIGEELSEVTVRRWFTAASYEAQPDVPARIKESVRNNSLAGFKKAMQALCAYDVRERMSKATVKGLFVAGDSDGVLPKTMQTMAEDLKVPGGAELKIVEGAGHLPMAEQPERFAEVVNGFLHA